MGLPSDVVCPRAREAEYATELGDEVVPAVTLTVGALASAASTCCVEIDGGRGAAGVVAAGVGVELGAGAAVGVGADGAVGVGVGAVDKAGTGAVAVGVGAGEAVGGWGAEPVGTAVSDGPT
ncbi:MAG: hypothetical protein QOF57_1844 [Frankiaceae bacterium]|nr:hypothetical protein [Frankiaceae bacterium]